MGETGAIARPILATIRIANGVLGLVYPNFLIRRLGGNPAVQTLAPYPFRMFGIRTVLLGTDLLLLRGEQLKRATRIAVVIHASDTLCAALGGIRREVPPRVAVSTTSISAVNTGLALLAWRAGCPASQLRSDRLGSATGN